MSAAQHEYLDLSPLLVEGHRAGYCPGRQGRFELFEFFKIGLGLLEVCLKARLLLRIARLLYIVLQLLNFLGHSREMFFDERYATHTSIRFGQLVLCSLRGYD